MQKKKSQKLFLMSDNAYDSIMRHNILYGIAECPECGPEEEGRDTGCRLCTRPKIVLSKFALSHFDDTKHKPAIPGISPKKFEKEINRRIPVAEKTGYAPFCRLFFYENWTNAQSGIIEITDEIQPFIRTEYEARRETELPVLMRYFPGEHLNLKAKYLCVIVYDKNQMAKEGTKINADYGIVNILRLMDLTEPPLPPITMMRNALGINEGGSGVPINRTEYLASVYFWDKNISVKPGKI